jgi:nitrite reductase (NO-forming)
MAGSTRPAQRGNAPSPPSIPPFLLAPPPSPRPTARTTTLLSLVALIALVALGLSVRAATRPTTTPAAAGSLAPGAYRLQGAGSGRVVPVSLTATEATQQIAPGVRYHTWTFDGTVPGPVIRVRVGDTVRFTLTNKSTMGMDHSIDFHAAQTPWNLNYQAVHPGKTLSFDWVARFPGVFMYHCGTQPVLAHIANGMYGAIIVEPYNLSPADRDYVLVASELYPGAAPIHGVYQGDLARMQRADPAYVVFNGKADQYKTSPLLARPNERIRLWVLDAGPTLATAFHVIGALFDHVYPDGNPTNQLNGLQTYQIPPGGGAMFELAVPEAGLYPFVTHAFAYTGRGAVGVLKVDPAAPAPTGLSPQLGDPFSAGTLPAGGAGAQAAPAPAASAPAAPPASRAACAPAGTGGGTMLRLTARSSAFSSACLTAPANRPLTILLDNQDPGVPHNVAVYTGVQAATAVFTGALFAGPATRTYRVGALKPGRYLFRCDVHPQQMQGTLVVQ